MTLSQNVDIENILEEDFILATNFLMDQNTTYSYKYPYGLSKVQTESQEQFETFYKTI